jgi:hypothetical protein
MRINAMLAERLSLEEIAERLNAEKVPTIHGTDQMDGCICSEGIRFLIPLALERTAGGISSRGPSRVTELRRNPAKSA